MEKVNLELKYFCKDFSPIRKILKKTGAKKVDTFDQKDYFFNLPLNDNPKVPKRLKLRIQQNAYTLVYYERPEFLKENATLAKVILFKVRDKKLLEFLKQVLGIKAIVEKTRELWKKDNAIFNLDTVKRVGKIFEIEVSSTKSSSADQILFNNLKSKFLPHLHEVVKGSNVDLVLRDKN